MRTRGALFAVAALALVALAAANTKGTTLRGFTFSSDVSDFLAISEDICDIRKILNNKEPPYAKALQIYMDGKNTKSGLTMRRLTTGLNGDEPFWSTYQKHFKTPMWLDDVLQRAFSGLSPYQLPVQRVQLIVKSMESSLQMAVMMHKLDDSIQLLTAKKPDAALNALDAAWAIFVGGNTNCGLWTVTMKRANEFGTKVDCETSQAADKIRTAMLDAQKAVRAGDVAALKKARNTVESQLVAVYMQATITYAHEMYLDKAANLSSAEHQTEAYGFWRTIAPLVAQANSTAGAALDYWLFPGQPTTDDVDLKTARALSTAYKGLGVTPEDVGEYGKKQPELGCAAYVPTAADKGGLLTATDAKASLRPTDGAAPADAAAPAAAAKPAAAAAAPAAAAAAPAAAAAAAKPGARRMFA